MKKFNVKKYLKGGTPGGFHKPDHRDYSFGATLPVPFDWNTGTTFDVPIDVSDQNGSGSCTAQSSMNMAKIIYYKTHQLGIKDFSARFIYSQISLPQGGAYVRDGVATLLKEGICLNSDFPSNPETEDHMRDKTGLDLVLPLAKQYDIYPDDFAYAQVSSIDDIAVAIREHYCVSIGVSGSNEGWKQADVVVPKQGETIWGHNVVGISAQMRNGKKTIKFLNSWTENWGSGGYGFFSEEYLKTNLLVAYVITSNFLIPNMLKAFRDSVNNNEVYVTDTKRKYHIANLYTYNRGIKDGLWDNIQIGNLPVDANFSLLLQGAEIFLSPNDDEA